MKDFKTVKEKDEENKVKALLEKSYKKFIEGMSGRQKVITYEQFKELFDKAYRYRQQGNDYDDREYLLRRHRHRYHYC